MLRGSDCRAADALLIGPRWLLSDWLTLSEFVLPLFSARERLEQLAPLPGLVLDAESLVFLWLALALSLRRTEDARLPASLALLVALPLVNWVVIVVLLARPSAAAPPAPESLSAATRRERTRSALWGLGAGTLVAVFAVGLATLALGRYGLALFVGTPFSRGRLRRSFRRPGTPASPTSEEVGPLGNAVQERSQPQRSKASKGS